MRRKEFPVYRVAKHVTVKVLAGVLWSVPLGAEAPAVYAIRGARVVTGKGPILERATVIVRDGLIADVGAQAAIPADAWVIEAEGLSVYPGLMDALSSLGLPEGSPATQRRPEPPSSAEAERTEDVPVNSAWVRAADLLNPAERRIEAARNIGFTAAATFPMRGILCGQGAVIALAGDRPGEMVIHPSAGLYVTLTTRRGGGFPASLMGAIAYLRQVFLDADHYEQARTIYNRNPAGLKRPEYDRALEALLASPRVLLPASTAVEIARMLRLAAEIRRTPVLYGGHEAWRSAELLRESGVSVIVSLKWPERDRDADPDVEESLRVLEMREKAPATPATLAKAGVRFAFSSAGLTDRRDFVRAVRRALNAGLSEADALRALTLHPAEIYGLSDRLGTVEPGKIANLVVTSGDLFQEQTEIKHVFVDGRKYQPIAISREEGRP
ncbi:MAG: amidohydrolase family protein [Bryobacterales bacterium]|nr:amidohydrolase family protein [Bryobacteraceae bacterium]MDW8355482.1 amidohydrolase family protein [Bryobacterales bacterium]